MSFIVVLSCVDSVYSQEFCGGVTLAGNSSKANNLKIEFDFEYSREANVIPERHLLDLDQSIRDVVYQKQRHALSMHEDLARMSILLSLSKQTADILFIRGIDDCADLSSAIAKIGELGYAVYLIPIQNSATRSKLAVITRVKPNDASFLKSHANGDSVPDLLCGLSFKQLFNLNGEQVLIGGTFLGHNWVTETYCDPEPSQFSIIKDWISSEKARFSGKFIYLYHFGTQFELVSAKLASVNVTTTIPDGFRLLNLNTREAFPEVGVHLFADNETARESSIILHKGGLLRPLQALSFRDHEDLPKVVTSAEIQMNLFNDSRVTEIKAGITLLALLLLIYMLLVK